MKKPTLYIMCGVAGCGKSYWAEQFIREMNNRGQDIRYVSRDEIRFSMNNDEKNYFAKENAVFERFVGTICATLIDGFDIVADATHITKGSRNKLIHAIDESSTAEYNIIIVWIDIPLENCLSQNACRSGRAYVPEDVIKNMYNKFQEPSSEEDSRIREVWHVCG